MGGVIPEISAGGVHGEGEEEEEGRGASGAGGGGTQKGELKGVQAWHDMTCGVFFPK